MKDLNVEYVIEEMINEVNDSEVLYNLKKILENTEQEKRKEKKNWK